MANINDYAASYKKPIDQSGLTEADSACLNQLSYYNWDGIVPNIDSDGSISLKEAGAALLEKYENNEVKLTNSDDDIDKKVEFLRNIIENPRFSSLEMSNYCERTTSIDEVNDISDIEQFAAVTFSYKEKTGNKQINYAAFRGTDGSLAGWNEDTNLAMYTTRAEMSSAEYLDIVAKKREGDIIPGGHSKAVALIVYGALNCKDKTRNRIVAIYGQDGPAFDYEALRNPHFKQVYKLMVGNSFAPYDSIIGQIFFNASYEYVDTDAIIGLDHSLFTWQIDLETGQFIRREQSDLSKYINHAIDYFLLALPEELEEKFNKALWKAIYSGEYENIDDVEWVEVIIKIIYDSDLTRPEKIYLVSALFISLRAARKTRTIERSFESIEDYFKFYRLGIDAVVSSAKKIYENAKETYILFKDFMNNVYDAIANSIADWYDRTFNVGRQYSDANPEIIIDTWKLRDLANRLDSVNSNIASIEYRIDSLYYKVGLLDLWNLMCADLLTGYSWRLQRCSSYLRETADEFERVESELGNNI